MADSVVSQVYDGARNYQTKLTLVSDGSGLNNVTVVDPTTMTPNPGLHLKLRTVRYAITSMSIRLQWIANSNIDIVVIGQGEDILDFSKEYAAGWPNAAALAAGVTGGISISTIGAVPNASFVIDLGLIKGV